MDILTDCAYMNIDPYHMYEISGARIYPRKILYSYPMHSSTCCGSTETIWLVDPCLAQHFLSNEGLKGKAPLKREELNILLDLHDHMCDLYVISEKNRKQSSPDIH